MLGWTLGAGALGCVLYPLLQLARRRQWVPFEGCVHEFKVRPGPWARRLQGGGAGLGRCWRGPGCSWWWQLGWGGAGPAARAFGPVLLLAPPERARR